jgi:hypothetical protein
MVPSREGEELFRSLLAFVEDNDEGPFFLVGGELLDSHMRLPGSDN